MRQVDTARDKQVHPDCATEPPSFTSKRDVAAVQRLHASHGPDCLPYWAAFAYDSAEVDD
ncbi:hypothetical protein ACWF9G_23070 [Nocardia sp. NPDC055029]